MKLTFYEIRALCTESSYERGLEYFHQGRVKNLSQFGKKTTATVTGTNDYKVTICADKEDIEASCTCPYDWSGYCKHIVATLIALSTDYHKVKKDGEEKAQEIEAILNSLSLNELREFLMAEFEENLSLRDHVTIYFSGRGSRRRSILDYKKEINLLYRQAAGRHGFIEYGVEVDFSYICDLADRYIKVENFLEAACIYQALSEVIAENMDNVDDSDGYYGDEFEQALENFVNCTNKRRLDHKGKKGYILYLFGKYMENKPDYFQENYNYALREICQSSQDLEYWKGLLEPYLPRDLPDHSQWSEYYQAKKLLMMQLHILDRLDDGEGFYKLIQRYYRQNHEFCLLYAHRLEKDGKIKGAVKIAEEGINIFPDHLVKELRRFLGKLYKRQSPEYKENLVALFLQDRKWDDYEKLRRACSQEEWSQLLSVIISDLPKRGFSSEDTIIDIYLREEIFDKAIEGVLAQRNLSTLSRYHKELSGRYSEKYFNAYRELITPFAESGIGRPHYREIVRYLKEMRQIKGFEPEFRELVSLLKERYSNSPAFLDEMRRMR